MAFLSQGFMVWMSFVSSPSGSISSVFFRALIGSMFRADTHPVVGEGEGEGVGRVSGVTQAIKQPRVQMDTIMHHGSFYTPFLTEGTIHV